MGEAAHLGCTLADRYRDRSLRSRRWACGVGGHDPALPRSVPLPWYTGVVFGEVLWTEDSETHIGRHNVTPLEVEQVLYNQPRLAVPGRDDTTEVLGQTGSGRLLLVVVTEAGDGRDFVVTARDMTVAEKRAFGKRSR